MRQTGSHLWQHVAAVTDAGTGVAHALQPPRSARIRAHATNLGRRCIVCHNQLAEPRLAGGDGCWQCCFGCNGDVDVPQPAYTGAWGFVWRGAAA
jgi:hypothetical protein